MISARRGPMPVILAASFEARGADLAVQAANLGGGGGQPVRQIAPGTAHAVHRANHGRGGGGSRDHAVDLCRAEAGDRAGDALLNILPHAHQLARIGGIALQEHFGEAHRAQGLGERFDDVPGVAQDQLGAAAADIRHQQALLGMRPLALHAQMHQARFFQTGDDFHRRSQNGGRARQKFGLIAGVAQSGGADDSHRQHVQLAIGRGHSSQDVARQIHGGFVQAAFAKNAGAQAHHLALRGEHLHLAVGVHFRRQHANGIAADIDGCVLGHDLCEPIFCNTTLTKPAGSLVMI